MFLDFYKMKDQPFGVTPDPRFLYLGRSHREALASLYYAVESDRGFVALIAPPGLGKTTLIFQLLEKLQQGSRTVFLFQTQCNSKELIHYLLNALGVDGEGMELVSMHNKLNEILCREMLAGRRFVLAIDEAQNLDWEVLETIRLLSNFGTSQAKLLLIVLIGQPQLARKLASPELEQLRQRISVFTGLEPFGSEDISNFIAHRLKIAGYEGAALFTPEALRMVAEQSQGIPRKINGLCFSALSLGCALGRSQVDAAIMEEVLADRDVESFQRTSTDRHMIPAQATPPPVLTVYPAQKNWSYRRWALGTASASACLAIVAGLFILFPSRTEQSIQKTSGDWNSTRDSMPIGHGYAAMKPGLVSQSSNLNVAAVEVPKSGSGHFPASTEDAEIGTVVVQPGDTMGTIILRNLGEYNDVTIARVRELNPAIANLDFLVDGQTVRLPLPRQLTIAPLNTDKSTPESSREMGHGE
jgi:type II secretory pathway predicted ATPase ExeA